MLRIYTCIYWTNSVFTNIGIIKRFVLLMFVPITAHFNTTKILYNIYVDFIVIIYL